LFSSIINVFSFTKRDSLPKRINDFFSEDFLNDEVVLDVVAGGRPEEETVEDTGIEIKKFSGGC
jgi:hypothetical protein